jgi:hypothetical protein
MVQRLEALAVTMADEPICLVKHPASLRTTRVGYGGSILLRAGSWSRRMTNHPKSSIMEMLDG